MVFKNRLHPVFWSKVASAWEGLNISVATLDVLDLVFAFHISCEYEKYID